MTNKTYGLTDEHTLDNIADALSQTGFIVLKDALNNKLLNDLQIRIKQIPCHQWTQAGVGRKQNHQVNTEIRSDKISWMTQKDPVEKEFLECMEHIRLGINRRLYLGLFDYESHFAIYPKDSFYQKHVDALKGQSNRVISTVVYLNDDWKKDSGGELIIYIDSETVQTVAPNLGTVVIFLSESVPHEVLNAHQERHSIAGWFRVIASDSNYVDPSQ